MLMKVLLSINPEYVEKIFSGEKKYEFRRSIFKNKNVDTIVIYCTSPIKKVVGEFKIKQIIEDFPEKLWKLNPKRNGISKEKFETYFFKKEKGYAIEIAQVRKYRNFKTLQEVDSTIKAAPQSFLYL